MCGPKKSPANIAYSLYLRQICSVATQLKCGGMFNSKYIYYKFFPECAGEKMKTGQYLAKIWKKNCGLLFWPTAYNCSNLLTVYARIRRFQKNTVETADQN